MDPTPLRPKDLLDEAARDLTRQSYASAPPIAGVLLDEARVFASPDGTFAELMRLDGKGQVEGVPGFAPVQWNWSRLEAGAIKAWHVHLAQDDLWIIPPDAALLVGLVDLRRGSPTASNVKRLTLGHGRCHRLFVPRGVAHGMSNPSAGPQTMLYAVNQFFSADPDETDEWRLPWDRFGERFWEVERG